MWLEQKIITFQSEKEPENGKIILDNIFLKVNENLTTVLLKDLFLKMNTKEDNIDFNKKEKSFELKGWSILEKVVPITKLFAAHTDEGDKAVEISFYSEQLGNIIISDIENPWVQGNDKKFEEEDLKQFEKDIIQLSLPKEEKKVEGVGDGLLPLSAPVLLNKKYESGKKRYIDSGYKEYVDGNYRLLLKKSPEKIIAILVELLDENNLNQFGAAEKSDVENFYQFKDDTNNKKLNAKIIDDSLQVEVINN